MSLSSILLLVCISLVNSKHYAGHSMIRVIPESYDELYMLSLLIKVNSPNITEVWREPSQPNKPVDIQLELSKAHLITEQLEFFGLSYEVMIANLESEIQKQKRQHSWSKWSHISQGFDYEIYHTWEEIVGHLRDIAARHDGVTYSSIGESVQGRDISSVYIGNGDKPVVAFVCGTHAREWISPAACVYLIDQLVVFEPDNPLRKAYDWVFIPILNVDGYEYSWRENRFWRKNLANVSDPDCMGVDLNRNYDANFGGSGASDRPCSSVYHGPNAFSEPETAAHRDMLLDLKDRLIAHFSLHSYSQMWLTAYGSKEEYPPEYEEMMRVANAGVKALAAVYGTEYEAGSGYHVIYQTSGGGLDWTYETLGINYTYTLELRDQGDYGFLLPEDQIVPTCVELWAGIQAAVSAISDKEE